MGMIKSSSCDCFRWHPVRSLLKHGACHVTPDPSKRPRRRWSRRMGSLEVMVKSMLDLRQLETFAHKKNGSFNEKERQSTPSQVCTEVEGSRWRLCAVLTPVIPAAGQQSQETSALVVLALLQGHPGSWWSRVLPRGEPGRCKSPGQVLYIPAQSAQQQSQQHWQGTKLLRMFVSVYCCAWFSTSHSLLSNISGQVEEGQDGRMQWRDTRSDSQESHSPDSACYVSYDSGGSSPDCNLDGELHTPYSKVTKHHIFVL